MICKNVNVIVININIDEVLMIFGLYLVLWLSKFPLFAVLLKSSRLLPGKSPLSVAWSMPELLHSTYSAENKTPQLESCVPPDTPNFHSLKSTPKFAGKDKQIEGFLPSRPVT